MNYRRLGRTGLKVSEICLGTMTFGHNTDEVEAMRIVDLAFDAGINFFDTANSYADSASETILGKALQGRRRNAVVATKFFNPMGTDVNSSGTGRFHLMHAVEDSLRRLQMETIDIFYIHHVDTQTPLDETLRAFDDLVRQGKVRYTACSNFEAWRLMETMWLSDRNGWERFAAYQPQYSLVVRDIEQEIIPVCELKGIGVVVWSPLGGGFLTGKYSPGQRTLSGTRSEEGWAYPHRYFAANADETLGRAHGSCRGVGAQSGAGGDSLDTGTERHHQRNRRRAHIGAGTRQLRGRWLEPACGCPEQTQRGFPPAGPLPEIDGNQHARAAQQRGGDAVVGQMRIA